MVVSTYSIFDAVLASALAGGVATTLGSAPVLFWHRRSPKAELVAAGFGAGVMLAASAFSLLMPGLERAESIYANPVWAAFAVAMSFIVGGALVYWGNKYFPHEHFLKGVEGPNSVRIARLWLFVTTITLHNFPEGLAVGVSFADGEVSNAISLSVGMAAQNFPEGLVVALAITSAGYSRKVAVGVTALSGFVEPIGAALGFAGANLAAAALPLGLGFAAGAMVFVVSDEIIPESHREGHSNATLGLMVGFALMMLLDVALAH